MGAALSMNPADLLLSRLEGVQKSGRGWRAVCPACGGKSKKLSINEADSGSVLLHCFGECATSAIVEAMGLGLNDLFATPLRPMTDTERREAKRRQDENRRAVELARKREADEAAMVAVELWNRLPENGYSDYLDVKMVDAFGLRFTTLGSAVVPVRDVQGRIHGLQFLRSAADAEKAKRPAKEFWPRGVAKKGNFHLVGTVDRVVLVAEGYATAASLHMATDLPVAVAFDAGNLRPVAEALRYRWKQAKILVCADDDCWTVGNPGVTNAISAALAVNGEWIRPAFADEAGRQSCYASTGVKHTDFNDLHLVEGLNVVREQVFSHQGRLPDEVSS